MAESVLVTGATGFVGRHLIPSLLAAGYRVRAAARAGARLPESVEAVTIGDLRGDVDWRPSVAGIDVIVHLAGLAHAAGSAAAPYDAINCEATAALGQAAACAGVRRFVFVSSILAQAGPTASAPVAEADPPKPAGPYGASKLAAERALAALPLPVVNLRPVLVYGEGVAGNMRQLLTLARLPVPLPFAAIRNRRSLLAVEDLAAAILLVMREPRAANETFLVADDTPLALPDMIAALRAGLGRKPALVAVPPSLLQAAARLGGMGPAWERAAGSLEASNEKLRALGWVPAIATRAGLGRLAAAPPG